MDPGPFDAHGADGFVATRVVFYASLYPRLRQTAREHGYALALHGSLVKDLDVLATPWIEDAVDPVTLTKALTETAGGFVVGEVSRMPHGRLAWSIYLGKDGGYIDLSVVGYRGGT